MTYIKTKLKKDIVVDSIITIHYFEYMKDFVFHGESHDFWEFLYVDKGSVLVRAGDDQFRLDTGDIIFHEPNEFHAIRSVGNVSPNLVVMSFTSASPAMDLFRRKSFALTMEERTLISAILNAAREAFSTPLHIPSIEQVKLNEQAPFGAQQFVQLCLELFPFDCCQTDFFPQFQICRYRPEAGAPGRTPGPQKPVCPGDYFLYAVSYL